MNPSNRTDDFAPTREGEARRSVIPHVCVCICTYKRPHALRRVLCELGRQQTSYQFTYSIAVVDNDEAQSGEEAIGEFRSRSKVPISYLVEPTRGIARARNRVVLNAAGDYLALIDDDEYPEQDWLAKMFEVCKKYNADGVLGPVLREFEGAPPAWLRKSNLYSRTTYSTGVPVGWLESRTSNALIKRSVFAGDDVPFRPQLRCSEDQDFFHRKIEAGFNFVWTEQAIVHEVLAPSRWTCRYLVQRALMQGASSLQMPLCQVTNVGKSILAVPVYIVVLPFTILFGQHRFMVLLEKLCHHLGKLLKTVGIDLVREEYVSS